jgi:class 3 adenylate cyclase
LTRSSEKFRNTSPAATEKILSQRDRIEGERRHVTIMFVDMKGFTPLTEKLGPEVTFSLMDKVFELLIHKVHDYEGTVNEMRGDGVLAFFVAPIALEDAPQRAIRSSLAIHRELTRFNDKLKSEEKIPPVLVRIGINSAPSWWGTSEMIFESNSRLSATPSWPPDGATGRAGDHVCYRGHVQAH